MTRDEADSQLRQAIIDHAVAYGLVADDGELLNDYAVIAHWARIETDGTSPYTTHFTNDEVPTHIAIGLFELGASIVLNDDPEDLP